MMKNFGYEVRRKLLVFLNKNNDEFTTISINKIEEKLDGNVEEELLKMKEDWQKKNSLVRWLGNGRKL